MSERATADVFDDKNISHFLGSVDVNIDCGDAFCDTCGDCLSCFPDCYERVGGHWWVYYADSLEDAARELDEDGSMKAVARPVAEHWPETITDIRPLGYYAEAIERV